MSKIKHLLAVAICLVCGSVVRASDFEVISTVFDEGFDFTTCTTETLVCENVSLSQVVGIGGRILGKFGNVSVSQTVNSVDAPLSNAGVFFFKNDNTTLTAQFQCKSYGAYAGVWHCIKVELTQSGSDLVGKILYSRSGTGNYGSYNLGEGWTLGNNWDATPYTGNAYEQHLYDLFLIKGENIVEEDLSGSILTWNGGTEGLWDSATANWLTEDNEATAWIPGAYARFTAPARVTVSDEQKLFGILIDCAGVVELSGDQLATHDSQTFPLPVTFSWKNATLRVANELQGDSGFTVAADLEVDESVYPSELDPEADFTSTEDILVCRNVHLSDVGGIRGRFAAKFGNNAARTAVVDSAGKSTSNLGVYFYENDGETLTAQFQGKSDGGYGGVYHCMKVQLTQVGDDIYGRLVYNKSATGSYGPQNFGADWSVGRNFDDVPQYKFYESHLYGLSLLVANKVLDDPCLEICGDYKVNSTLSVGEGTAVHIVGDGTLNGGVFSNTITIEGTFIYASSVELTLPNFWQTTGSGYLLVAAGSKVRTAGSYGSDRNADLRIAGEYYADQYRGIPTGGAGTRVLDGGVLTVGGNMYYDCGLGGDAPLYLEDGATMILTRQYNLGYSKSVYVNGGTVTNSVDKEQLIYKFHMSDGSRYVGPRADAGYNGNYGSDSVLTVSGVSPSFFEAERFYIGTAAKNAEDKKPSILRLEVSDVTGDSATDLYITSQMGEMFAETIVDPYYFGLTKRGTGTVEFTGADNALTNGVFKLDGGAVRLGAGCSGVLPALVLISDSQIDVAGGRIEFGASAPYTWTEGASLNFTGKPKGKSIRIGRNAASITAEQLAQMKFNGKAGRVSIDTDGYLVFQTGYVVSVK